MERTTSVYCACGNELIKSESFISDTYDDDGKNHVIYKCSNCGIISDFNFDLPVPILQKRYYPSGTALV